IARALGFRPDCYTNARYSLDRPNIYYIPRFFSHPNTGSTFLDLAFLIPFDACTIDEIHPVVLFADSIRTGQSILEFLDSLLDIKFPHVLDRHKIIRLYNSMFDHDYRDTLIRDFENPSAPLRIIIATETLTYGIDLCVDFVITVDLITSPERRAQNLGRSGRDGLPARAITFCPPWVREIPVTAQGPSTIQAKEDASRREKLPKATRQWYNPTSQLCPRASVLTYFGESLSPSFSDTCQCVIHKPELDPTPSHLACIEKWRQLLESKIQRTKAVRGMANMFRPLEGPMKQSLFSMISRWKAQRWSQIRGDNIYVTSDFFLPPDIVQRIVDRAHACTSLENFQAIAHSWDYVDEHGADLFNFLHEALTGFRAAFWEMQEEDSDEEMEK
ncbi:hypothetical protein F5880DRAFT_1440260, partial [Lentinula raphanica]